MSETRLPLTKNGVTLLFARLKKRAGITSKRISPHIFRHTFAIRSLILGNDPFSLQELLGHEDMTTVKNCMHMNEETIQQQKRKYSPGDHLPASFPGPRETRRRGFRTKESQGKPSVKLSWKRAATPVIRRRRDGLVGDASTLLFLMEKRRDDVSQRERRFSLSIPITPAARIPTAN